MFRLKTAFARQGRQVRTGLLLPAIHVPAPTMTIRRTLKQKVRLRPSPKANKTMKSGKKPVEIIEPRPLSDFQVRFEELEMRHVTAQEAHDIYTKYLKAMAVEDKPADWQEKFVRDNDISAAKLHETATIVFAFPNIFGGEFEIFCNMMNAAAGLGDDAAALSLGRILALGREPDDYFHWDQPWWRNTRERCRALIKEGRDANALVLNGLVHLGQKTPKDDHFALEAFVQAEELGKDAARFDWKPTCIEGQGEAYLRLKEKKKAEDAFMRLAHMDCARGYYRLAKMFPKTPLTLDWLTKAAASGLGDSYSLLVDEHERLRSVCESQGRDEEARRHERDAAEWTMIMRAKALRLKEVQTATKHI